MGRASRRRRARRRPSRRTRRPSASRDAEQNKAYRAEAAKSKLFNEFTDSITTVSRLDAAKSLAEKGSTTLCDLNKKGPDPAPKKKARLIVAHTSPTVMVGLSVCQKSLVFGAVGITFGVLDFVGELCYDKGDRNKKDGRDAVRQERNKNDVF